MIDHDRLYRLEADLADAQRARQQAIDALSVGATTQYGALWRAQVAKQVPYFDAKIEAIEAQLRFHRVAEEMLCQRAGGGSWA